MASDNSNSNTSVDPSISKLTQAKAQELADAGKLSGKVTLTNGTEAPRYITVNGATTTNPEWQHQMSIYSQIAKGNDAAEAIRIADMRYQIPN